MIPSPQMAERLHIVHTTIYPVPTSRKLRNVHMVWEIDLGIERTARVDETMLSNT
jgi:hypothetical protein